MRTWKTNWLKSEEKLDFTEELPENKKQGKGKDKAEIMRFKTIILKQQSCYWHWWRNTPLTGLVFIQIMSIWWEERKSWGQRTPGSWDAWRKELRLESPSLKCSVMLCSVSTPRAFLLLPPCVSEWGEGGFCWAVKSSVKFPPFPVATVVWGWFGAGLGLPWHFWDRGQPRRKKRRVFYNLLLSKCGERGKGSVLSFFFSITFLCFSSAWKIY